MAPTSVILSDLLPQFQGHDIIQRQITQKWYKIELYLPLKQLTQVTHLLKKVIL